MHTQVSDMTDLSTLRKTLGSFLTGVTVVTTYDNEGQPRGMTVNSFSSVSLVPPLVSFCIDQNAGSLEVFKNCKSYAINVLGADQQELALHFARRGENKFEGMAYQNSPNGVPLLQGAIAWFDCTVHQCVEAGDHIIVIGQIQTHAHSNAAPLGFFQGAFVSPNFGVEAHLQNPTSEKGNVRVGWLLENPEGDLALSRTPGGKYEIPVEKLTLRDLDYPSLSDRVSSLIGCKAQIQFLFSMYATHDSGELVLVYRGTFDHKVTRENVSLNNIVLINTQNEDFLSVMDRTDRSIINRYLQERVGAGFGIYSGHEFGGSVATTR